MDPHLAAHNTKAGILARLVQTRRDDLSHDAADVLSSLRFDDIDISRMNELSEMARPGAPATADAAELDSYIHASNLLAVIQSKARQALRGAA